MSFCSFCIFFRSLESPNAFLNVFVWKNGKKLKNRIFEQKTKNDMFWAQNGVLSPKSVVFRPQVVHMCCFCSNGAEYGTRQSCFVENTLLSVWVEIFMKKKQKLDDLRIIEVPYESGHFSLILGVFCLFLPFLPFLGLKKNKATKRNTL